MVPVQLTPKSCSSTFWDGIKGLQLRRCGKLNSTHPGKLWRSTQDTFYPLCTAVAKKESLMYCGASCTAAAAVDKPQYTRDSFFYLVYCGASCTAAAAVGIDAPQFESFYTVPYFFLKKRAKKLQCTKFAMYPVERHKYLVH